MDRPFLAAGRLFRAIVRASQVALVLNCSL